MSASRLRAAGLAIAASLGLMAAVVWTLAGSVITGPPFAILALVSLAILLVLRPNPTWLLAVGAVVGWISRV